MKRDQKGFTIVELLIAVAILSIVIAAVCGFILVGSRSYAAGNSDISVQQEAQLALNQMSDVLIDTTRSVTYTGYDAGGTTSEKALKDAEFSFTPENKSLVMINGVVEVDLSDPSNKTVDPGNGNKHYHFFWSKQDETLYYAELDVQSTDVDTVAVANSFPSFDPTDPKWVELAGHVTDFSVDLSQVEEKRVVQLALTFLDGTKEYVTSNNVTIRNKVGVNDVTLDPLNKKKTLSVTPRDSGVIIEPGETYHFSTPKVTGENVADRSVEWSVVSAGSSGTDFTDKANGILKVASDEPAGKIELKITTNAVDSDNNKASCPVFVDIKRVTAVNLSKTSDTDSANDKYEISPGCTFTISADVTGHKLGEVCSVCGDDTSVDKWVVYDNMGYTCRPNVHGRPLYWYIHNPSVDGDGSSSWDPTQYIEIVDQAEDHATFRVKANAPTSIEGDPIHTYGVVIQAAAFLPEYPNAYDRDYGMVGGAIGLTMVKGSDKKNIQAGGSLHWGASTEIKWDDLSPYHYYVVCARVREYGTDSKEQDKIMMYLTEGNTTRVTPDMFGVEDVSKPWYLSLQVLNPGKEIPPGVGLSSSIKSDVEAQVNDPTVRDIINDYLANCDSSGTYVGEKYLHSDKLEAMINPPEIFYAYDGQTNLGGELKLKTVSALGGPAWTEFKVDYVKNTRDETLGYWFANNNVKFSMYKEKSDGTLEKIYWYNGGGNYYEGNANPYDNALQLSEIQSAAGVKIKLDLNKPNKLSEAAGKYRLIPTIIYEQGSWADHVGGVSVYYVNYDPNYKQKQCYEDKRSTVYYELLAGGNVDAFWSYYDNRFSYGEIYFPTPSEAGFTDYFDREITNWQNAKKLVNFKKLVKGSDNATEYKPSSMQCHYVKDKSGYELELFYKYRDTVWDIEKEVSAGVFKYDAGVEKWIQIKQGTLDSQLKNGNMNPQMGATANAEFWTRNGHYKGKIYIPLPSDSAFTGELGFELKKSGIWQTKYGYTLKYQANGQQNVEQLGNIMLKCYYDADKREYTMQMWDWNSAKGEWEYKAAFKCTSDGDWWTQV